MEAAVISHWEKPARGREQEALAVFMDTNTFWDKQAANGKCSGREVYIALDGRGMTVVRGEDSTLMEILNSDGWRDLTNRILLNVDGYRLELWAAGDEVTRIVTSYAEAIAP